MTNTSSAEGPRLARSKVGRGSVNRPQPAASAAASSAMARGVGRMGVSSDEGGFQHDAAVHHAGGAAEQGGQRLGHLGGLAELAQEVDEPAHGPDQVALVAAERLLDDAR